MMMRATMVAAMALAFAACSNGGMWNSSAKNDQVKMNDPSSDMGNEGTNSSTGAMHSGAGDQTAMGGMQPSGNIAEQDRNFVEKASQGGQYEVQSSQLALQKTQDARVRMIAQHMIQDHTKANQELSQAAQQKGVMAKTGPSSEQKKMIGELQGLNGSDFDQKYISQQTQAHKDTIALFEQEASNGSDATLKGWAAQTLPTLQGHLRMISGDSNNMSSEQR